MSWAEEARKHTEYTRKLVEKAANGSMVSIDCAMYLYEQALLHGWKHAIEYMEECDALDKQRPSEKQEGLRT